MYKLTGTVPAKKNSRINTRSGRSFPSKAYTEWHERAALEIMSQGIAHFDKVAVNVQFYFKTNRRTDLDNKLSSILDLFQDLEIIPDDRWQVVPQICMSATPHSEDAVVIILEELE